MKVWANTSLAVLTLRVIDDLLHVFEERGRDKLLEASQNVNNRTTGTTGRQVAASRQLLDLCHGSVIFGVIMMRSMTACTQRSSQRAKCAMPPLAGTKAFSPPQLQKPCELDDALPSNVGGLELAASPSRAR